MIHNIIKRYTLHRIRTRCNTIGENNVLHRTIQIQGNGPVSLGNNIFIAQGCLFSIRGAGLIIEDNVMIGPKCMIYDWNHTIDPAHISIRHNSTDLQSIGSVQLMADCWIGAGSIILAGVCVGTGAVVGAGSIVTKNIPPYAIVAGNPALFKRWREGYSKC